MRTDNTYNFLKVLKDAVTTQLHLQTSSYFKKDKSFSMTCPFSLDIKVFIYRFSLHFLNFTTSLPIRYAVRFTTTTSRPSCTW